MLDAKDAIVDGCSVDIIKLPTYFSLAAFSSASVTLTEVILYISLIISVTALSVTSFLTLAVAVNVPTYLLVDAEEYEP